jgi:heme A synthase
MKRRHLADCVRHVVGGLLIAVSLAGAHALAQNAPAAPANAVDIRDIRGPKPIPSLLLPIMLAAGALVIAGAGYAAWRWARRRKPQPAKLPFEIALQRLADARATMRPDNGRAFSIEVSDAVREYIEQRFHVMAAHRTTYEFLYDLLGSPDALLAEHRTLLADFLNLCDLAKFAGWQLSMEEMETMHRHARAFVLATGLGAERKSALTPPPSSGKEIYGSLPAT